MQFFNTSINDLNVLKTEYRKLVKIHHPDMGGNSGMMQMVNNEYEVMQNYIRNGGVIPSIVNNANNTRNYTQQRTYEAPRQNVRKEFNEYFNRVVTIRYDKDIKEAIFNTIGRNRIIDIFLHKGSKEGYVIYVEDDGNRYAAALRMKVMKKYKQVSFVLTKEFSYEARTSYYINMPLEFLKKLDGYSSFLNEEQKEISYLWRERVYNNAFSSVSLKQKEKKKTFNNGDKITIQNGYVTINGEKVNTLIVMNIDNKISFNYKGKIFNVNGWEKWNYKIVEGVWA